MIAGLSGFRRFAVGEGGGLVSAEARDPFSWLDCLGVGVMVLDVVANSILCVLEASSVVEMVRESSDNSPCSLNSGVDVLLASPLAPSSSAALQK